MKTTICLVFAKSTIEKEDKTFYVVKTSDGTVFVDKEQHQKIEVGTTVIIMTEKYRLKNGEFRTNKAIAPIGAFAL